MPNTFLFYDVETTGLNVAFDQVLQFAAIRTDMALNVLEEHEFLVRPTPGVVPSPMAMITHRLSMDDLSQGLSEIEAIKKIHQLLNKPGTISCGYNTLGFDDELLRFSFYRHLLTPYTHQYAQGCGRMDIYPMVLMYYLYHTDILNWPKDSLKLEQISQCNQLVSGPAHHAMTDVRATLALARKLKNNQNMWAYVQGYFHKATDQKRMMDLPVVDFNVPGQTYREGLMVLPQLGAQAQFQAPVLWIGDSQVYKNQTLWLRLDQPELMETTFETVANTFVIRKKAADVGFVLPYIPRYTQPWPQKRLDQVIQQKQWFMDHPAMLQAISDHHRQYIYPEVPDVDIQAALYLRGFLSSEDLRLCQLFHQSAPEDKGYVVAQMTDVGLQTLALRLMKNHYHKWLPEDQACLPEQETATDHRAQPRLTARQACDDITQIRSTMTLDAHQQALLSALSDYIQAEIQAGGMK